MRTARSLPYSGGVSAWRVFVRQMPLPHEQNDWQRGAKTLPSRNFVCGR